MSDADMKNQSEFFRSAVASIPIAIACALMLGSFASQTARADSTDARNFEGNWRNVATDGPSVGGPPSGGPPAIALTLPYTAEARRIVEKRMDLSMRKQKAAVGTHLGCRPASGFEALSPQINSLVLQTPTKLTMFNQEERGVWHVYINQPLSKHLKPSYKGESVAHWEGDTLVVDTIGLNGKPWADMMGSPLSDKVHVVTRISKAADGNHLTLTATYTDPVYYTAPFTKTFNWERIDARLVDYDCAENPRAEEFESWTFEDDWYKPVCVRPIGNELASDKVICEQRPKAKH